MAEVRVDQLTSVRLQWVYVRHEVLPSIPIGKWRPTAFNPKLPLCQAATG